MNHSLDTILRVVCMELTIPIERLTGKAKPQHIVDARQIYAIIGRENGHTNQAIAERINRDESMIGYYVDDRPVNNKKLGLCKSAMSAASRDGGMYDNIMLRIEGLLTGLEETRESINIQIQQLKGEYKQLCLLKS